MRIFWYKIKIKPFNVMIKRDEKFNEVFMKMICDCEFRFQGRNGHKSDDFENELICCLDVVVLLYSVVKHIIWLR